MADIKIGGSNGEDGLTYIGSIDEIWIDKNNQFHRSNGHTPGGVIISSNPQIIYAGDNAHVTINGTLGNTSVGTSSLFANTTGIYNSAFGRQTLQANTIGHSNTALGNFSLEHNIDGNQNTGVGRAALYENTTGSYNTAVGMDSMLRSDTGDYNTAVGFTSLLQNASGNYNTVVGHGTLWQNISGSRNTVIGDDAGTDNISGSDNVFLGRHSGFHETGSNKLYIANSSTNNLITGDFSTGTVTFNDAYTFPTADGTASQVLTSDGAGNLSWANETITLSTLKSITAASSDFADFQTRIAAL